MVWDLGFGVKDVVDEGELLKHIDVVYVGLVYDQDQIAEELRVVYDRLKDGVSSGLNGLIEDPSVGYVNDSLSRLIADVLALHHSIHSRDEFKDTPHIRISHLRTHNPE